MRSSIYILLHLLDDGKRMLVEGSVCDTLLDVIMASCKGKSGKEVASVTHGAANLINLVLTGGTFQKRRSNDSRRTKTLT
jgi:hypothetical protein